MRYRRLDENYDYVFGRGLADFYIDTPDAVGQSALTRLMLWQGEWFYDTTDGTAWKTQVLGERTRATRDVVLRSRVRDTQGFKAFTDYSSTFDPNSRSFSVRMTLDTVYGITTIASPPPPQGVAPVVLAVNYAEIPIATMAAQVSVSVNSQQIGPTTQLATVEIDVFARFANGFSGVWDQFNWDYGAIWN